MRQYKNSLINLDRIQLVGFLISAFIGFFLLFTGQDTLTSIILGSVIAIFVQLLDVQKRMNDSEDRLTRATALSRQLYEDEWLYNQIEEIVSDYQEVETSWYEVFKLRAKDTITECHNEIHALAEGHMTYGGRSPYSFGVSGIQFAKKSLKAVSLSGHEFWDSVWAETFLQANQAAIKRGVKIVRVFMCSEEEIENLSSAIRKQQEIGIDVFIAPIEQAHRQLQEDFIIMDDRLVNFTEFNRTGKVKRWRQSTESVALNQASSKFDAIMRMARYPSNNTNSTLPTS